jgi:hypothetical protein
LNKQEKNITVNGQNGKTAVFLIFEALIGKKQKNVIPVFSFFDTS